MIGEALASDGHHVTWWTANFSHNFKRFRSKGWADISVRPNFTIRLVPTGSYEKNISVRRILFELRYAIQLYHRAAHLAAPDLILSVNPPQSTTLTAVWLARKHRARLIIDVYDLWPELFALALPQVLCWVG